MRPRLVELFVCVRRFGRRVDHRRVLIDLTGRGPFHDPSRAQWTCALRAPYANTAAAQFGAPDDRQRRALLPTSDGCWDRRHRPRSAAVRIPARCASARGTAGRRRPPSSATGRRRGRSKQRCAESRRCCCEGLRRQIGSRAVIGAGSVVTRNIPEGMFAAGNPCRVVREIAE